MDKAKTLAPATEEAGRNEKKQQFVELRAKGYSYSRIASRLKVGKSTLSEWNKELAQEVAKLRAMELEALQEKYWLHKEGRIKLLGEQVKAIQKELKGRSFTDVPTDKLLDLLLRYEKQLGEEIGELQSTETGTDPNDQAVPNRISGALQELYSLYTLGLLRDEQVKQSLGLLGAFLKANEQMAIEERLLTIESLLEQKG
jgi:transcriptional regulator with XRE-family HTH domain